MVGVVEPKPGRQIAGHEHLVADPQATSQAGLSYMSQLRTSAVCVERRVRQASASFHEKPVEDENPLTGFFVYGRFD